MNLRKIMALMAAALLLTSCSNEEEQEVSQPVPIRLSAVSSGVSTRADHQTNDNSTFVFPSDFTVSVDGSNYNHTATAYNTAMTCNVSPSPYFPVSGSSVHIVAYYPSTVTYSTSVQTFTVKHDQSQTADGTANYMASDLMLGLPKTDFVDDDSNTLIEGTGFARKVKHTKKTIPLEFEHRLAKIRIKCTTNGATVKKVEMTGIKRSIDYKSSTNALNNLALATGGTDAAANTIIMYEDATGCTTDFYCAAIIPPQTLAVGTAFITITTASGVPLVYKLPSDVTQHDFVSGTQYNFNVNINDYEIIVTSSITPWNTAVDGTDFTHGNGYAIAKSVWMNPLWYVATGNMTNNKSATTLTMGAATDVYCYQWSQAMSLFAKQTTSYDGYKNAGKIIDGQDGTWHLPVKGEWLSIVPVENASLFSYDSDTNDLYSKNVIFGYNSETKTNGVTDYSYWKPGTTEVHAIRFLGTQFCSAWKYELLGGWTSSSSGYLRVSATLIDCIGNSKTEAINWYNSHSWDGTGSNAITFGNVPSDLAVQRDFYAKGILQNNYGAPNTWVGEQCLYWSATEKSDETTLAWMLRVYNPSSALYGPQVSYGGSKNHGFPVRLFRDN